VIPHLAEPADTSALRGPKRRAKTDKADAKLLRELLAAGRLPECYIAPAQVLEWRALLELYQDLRSQHTGWAQRIHAVCFHRAPPHPGRPGSSAATGPGCAPSSTSNSRSPAGCRSTPPWPSWTLLPSTSTGCAAGQILGEGPRVRVRCGWVAVAHAAEGEPADFHPGVAEAGVFHQIFLLCFAGVSGWSALRLR
jgi:hypothetical protein